MTIIAIIFDHDGVMVDTEPLQSQAWIMILEKYGRTPKLNSNSLVHKVGITINENWDMLKSKYGITEDTQHLEEQRRKTYIDLLNHAQPMAGLSELLSSLCEEKKNGRLRIAIASSSNREYIEMVVGNLGYTDVFDVIISGRDVALGKPAPDIYQKVALELKVSPENCIVLEDSRTGVEAARAAKMKVIAIPNRYTEEQDFSNADMVVPSLRDVDLHLIYSCL
jgi:HAD superfamily hydrolase (TIGR01509 family)